MKFIRSRFVISLLVLSVSVSLQAQEKEAPVVEAKAAKAAKAQQPAKVEAKKEAKPEVVEEAAAEAEEEVDAEAQQYEQMLSPKMWRELEFLRENCDLTPEQRPKIKAAAQVSLRQAAKEFVRNNQRGRQAVVDSSIRNDLLKTLEKTLTTEQMTQYRKEAILRNADIKRSTIRVTVSRLDSLLYLSREQRDKISETLTEKWQESWEQWLVVSRYGGLYFPMIPNEDLVPHLNAQQKKIWAGATKINAGFWGGEQRQDADDEWWSGKGATDQPDAAASGAASKPADEGKK